MKTNFLQIIRCHFCIGFSDYETGCSCITFLDILQKISVILDDEELHPFYFLNNFTPLSILMILAGMYQKQVAIGPT